MHSRYPLNIREEELKNRVGKDFFEQYDTTKIIGNIDFCVAVPDNDTLFKDETESLVWAEAKEGTSHSITHSFVQLILTIGKARTFDHYLPPQYLAAFDCARLAFIPYHCIQEVFYQNDFNWNVTPSDHNSKEFLQLNDLVEKTLNDNMLLYNMADEEKQLREFIRRNIVTGNRSTRRHRVNKNNFTFVYQRWCEEVKKSIAVPWDKVKKAGLLDADFFLADLLSKDGNYLLDSLFVLLKHDHYQFDRSIDENGLFSSKEAKFNDHMKAHTAFWNKYERPPKREYWNYIVERRDLLVPQDVRERKGSFFTPQKWVELSQEYLARELGEDWQDEYYIWDCCAGTGNLLAGLTNKYRIWASTLDKADVAVMHERIRNGANLLESHVFQFDFLNDDFSQLPQGLQDIINDPEKRKKLVVYINPPYAEAGDIRQLSNTGTNKSDVAVNTNVYKKYLPLIGIAGREVFAQFFIRIYQEIPDCILAEFSKLKMLQAPNFEAFRKVFQAKIEKSFLVKANTFDNVKGRFPIGFFIWKTSVQEVFKETVSDVYESNGDFLGTKAITCIDETNGNIGKWVLEHKDDSGFHLGFMSNGRNDFQNQKLVYFINDRAQMPTPRGWWITPNNLIVLGIFLAVRHCIEATWLNDRDQFLYPNVGWQTDKEFQANCLVYTLFHGQNRISAQQGINHWIPFTEEEANAPDCFASHFMMDFMAGKTEKQPQQGDLFNTGSETGQPIFENMSPAAIAVMDAGREIWRYYMQQPDINVNASLYDIKAYFKGRDDKGRMNATSNDEHFNALMDGLRIALNALAKEIETKVYEYGFLK
jgi:hypothetical protein